MKRPNIYRFKAPAKVNLYLHVLQKRQDGFHDIDTLFERITLCDSLEFRPTDQGISLKCTNSELPVDKGNLVYRAASLLKTQYSVDSGIFIKLHKRFIFTALFWTALFLVSYLLYHFSTESTFYGGTGVIKYIYFFILITHITLAALIVPIALITVGRGLNMQVEKHKKIARWTMPLWLYVSFTGVVVYIMIAPYY